MTNSSIWPIARTLSGATTPGQSGAGSTDKKGVLHIPQFYSIIRASESDCFVISKTLMSGSGGGGPFCKDAICVFYSSRWLGS